MAYYKLHFKKKNMETHLKIEYLAPYLAYNIQGIDKVGNYYYLYSVDNRMSSFDLWMNGNFHKFNGSDGIKPILRPLLELDEDGEINTPEYLQGCCYSYVQSLISQHYDVFGLIEKGLAVDINTLNK